MLMVLKVAQPDQSMDQPAGPVALSLALCLDPSLVRPVVRLAQRSVHALAPSPDPSARPHHHRRRRHYYYRRCSLPSALSSVGPLCTFGQTQ